MRISRTGLCLAGPYALLSVLCATHELSITDDSKGRFVLLQAPLTPGLLPIDGLGLTPYLVEVPFSVAYLVLMPLQLVAFCGAGVPLGRGACRVGRMVRHAGRRAAAR